ncbi:hypothetical protein [Flavisolibacter tropicus]|uniref:hypothetical protein n=1 Tax=Flavisolibacter tropicus TaxID=1492898 RepID=UPI0011DF395D|nr:hypothetical protein [Flavisolibacter tropicus]
MNEFLELFGGPIAVLSSIIATILLARRWKNQRHGHTRKHVVALLYWGPVFLICCMVLHCFRNGYNTITNSISIGRSVFNFYHYSLQLFGVVLAYQAYVLLGKCRDYAKQRVRQGKSVYAMIALIVFTTLPTFYFTPIGIVPTVVLTISSIVSWFVHKSVPAMSVDSKQANELMPVLEEEAATL